MPEDDRHGLPTVEAMVEDILGRAIFPPEVHKRAAEKVAKKRQDDAGRTPQEGERV